MSKDNEFLSADDDFAEYLRATATAQARSYRADIEQAQAQAKLDTILAAYGCALEDPRARIPTALMCALEAARK